MKKSLKTTSIKLLGIAALTLTASQAVAFETEVERVGMFYINIPLSIKSSAPTLDKSVLGFRFGQTRLSTDRVGSLFSYFRTRPALFDVQFGMVGRLNSPEDVHFGLTDLKLTGISSVEKTYINGQAVVGGIIASKVLIGAAAVGGIGLAAAASGSGSSSSDSSDDKSSSSSSSHSSSSDGDDSSHDEAENEVEDHENEIEDEDHAEDENEIEDEDHAENELDDDLNDDDSHDNDDITSSTL